MAHCRVIEPQRFVEDLAVAHDRAAVRGQHEADESLVLELIEGGQHRRLVVADDRLPVRGLVAGGHEGVDGERVLLGRREGLLHQRAQHPRALRAQLHGREHTGPPKRPPHGEELGTEAPRVGDDAEKGGENIWISRIGIDLV